MDRIHSHFRKGCSGVSSMSCSVRILKNWEFRRLPQNLGFPVVVKRMVYDFTSIVIMMTLSCRNQPSHPQTYRADG
jgi:hypothetical protein